MKSIGICVTGLLRTWDSCHKNLIKNLIDTNKDYHFYLIGYIGGIENKEELQDKYDFDTVVVGNDIDIPNLEYQKKKYDKNPNSNFYINAHYQLYDLKKVSNLIDDFEKENSISLDYIIRTRSDLDILKPLKLPIPNDNTIYIPHGHDWFGYNDRFAYGNKKDMIIYLSRYDFWMKENNHIPNYSTHIESNLKIYLDSENIKVERLNDLNYSFKRSINGNEINVEGFYNGHVYMGPNNIIKI
jgi:hypothetical protein